VSENTEATGGSAVKLNGLYAFKEGMATVFNEQGEAVPVTVLRYEQLVVSQIKTDEKDGYTAIQVAARPNKAKNASASVKGHFKASGLENGAALVREIRQTLPEGVAVGAQVSIDSLVKGDVVKLTGVSKGHGFAGVHKRWNFSGGPATHGSKFHRRPGSSGNRTWPGRVMPGKKFPGHYGDETVTLKNVVIVDVIPSENVVLVKGPVPGARNSLVRMVRG
jgi:large subunit ribosomal protein L3